MYPCAVGEPPDGRIFYFYLFLNYLNINNGHSLAIIFFLFCFYAYSPMVCSFGGGGCKNVPATSATSYLVSLFILIYLVLFHPLPPYYLDVPCYLNNKLRYCAAWPESDRTFYISLATIFDLYSFD